MSVRRTLPQRARSMVGAWCFLDNYGSDDLSASAGMQVPPRPQTGLQTVSWLFAGEVLHHDSLGSVAMVRPGELNLMSAGHGISHSEQSPSDRSPLLHGAQLCVALPDGAPALENHVDLPDIDIDVDGATVRVSLGELAGARS
ncbi:pirin family protein [Pengzhenrongella sicca]|uniref:pirin family protein n=1 Tax=Pengzhenrongella sicca TaxID=2819238 RepID=UPI001D0C5392|nr:pirin family protein [Pengzhenrongella sicca]